MTKDFPGKNNILQYKKTTLSRLEAPHVTPIVKGPSSRKCSSKKREHFIWGVVPMLDKRHV